MFTATVLKEFEAFWVNHTAVVTATVPAGVSSVDPALEVGHSLSTDCYAIHLLHLHLLQNYYFL